MLDYKIYTFLKLCDELNYRKTAALLNMTQPAVTTHIKALEAEYDIKLFNYENRQLSLTPQAHILEKYARLAAYNEKVLRQTIIKPQKESLKIGATRTIGDYVLKDKLSDFLSKNDMLIDIYVENTETLLQQIKSGQLDIAFIEGYFAKENFDYMHYKTERLYGVCAGSHPFAGQSVDLAQLFDENFIIRELGSGTREIFERVLMEENYSISSFKSLLCSNSFQVIAKLVGANLGVSFVYESLVNAYDELASFELKGINAKHEFYIVYLKDAKLKPSTEFFISNI